VSHVGAAVATDSPINIPYYTDIEKNSYIFRFALLDKSNKATFVDYVQGIMLLQSHRVYSRGNGQRELRTLQRMPVCNVTMIVTTVWIVTIKPSTVQSQPKLVGASVPVLRDKALHDPVSTSSRLEL